MPPEAAEQGEATLLQKRGYLFVKNWRRRQLSKEIPNIARFFCCEKVPLEAAEQGDTLLLEEQGIVFL